MSKVYGYIYLIKDQTNNKVYVGQKKGDPEKSKNYFGSGKIIKSVIKNRGIYFLEKIVLGYCSSRDELNESEIECIKFFNSTDRNYGYNISNGGDVIRSFSGENNGMYDKNHSDEAKAKMSFTKKKLKIAVGENNPMYKKSLYEHWIEKYGIQEANFRQNRFNEKHRKIKNIDKLFDLKNLGLSNLEIAAYLKCSVRTVRRRLSNEYKSK